MKGGNMGSDKSKSKSTPAFAKGGSGKMFGKQSAGPKAPGVSGKETTGDGGKFAKGGSGHMFGKQSASPKAAGKSGK